MKEHEKQFFEDMIVKAVQSGKKETSGLVSDLVSRMQECNSNYSKRELDHHFNELHIKITDFRNENKTGMDTLDRKITYTNGTVRLHTKILLVVGTAISVLMATNGSELINFLKILI